MKLISLIDSGQYDMVIAGILVVVFLAVWLKLIEGDVR